METADRARCSEDLRKKAGKKWIRMAEDRGLKHPDDDVKAKLQQDPKYISSSP